MGNHGVTCSRCQNPARRMYRRWDELVSRGNPLEWLGVALVGVGLLTGPWGYLISVPGAALTVYGARRAPKKYYCETCDYGFFTGKPSGKRVAQPLAYARPTQS